MVSNIGNVKSVRYSKHKLLKYFKSKGYNKVDLQVKSIKTRYFVHRLVAAAFIGLDLNDPTQIINHKDGIRDHNEISNLEIVTMIENTIDGIKRNIDNDLVKYITYKNIKE